jgi:hypothetical protein
MHWERRMRASAARFNETMDLVEDLVRDGCAHCLLMLSED